MQTRRKSFYLVVGGWCVRLEIMGSSRSWVSKDDDDDGFGNIIWHFSIVFSFQTVYLHKTSFEPQSAGLNFE